MNTSNKINSADTLDLSRYEVLNEFMLGQFREVHPLAPSTMLLNELSEEEFLALTRCMARQKDADMSVKYSSSMLPQLLRWIVGNRQYQSHRILAMVSIECGPLPPPTSSGSKGPQVHFWSVMNKAITRMRQREEDRKRKQERRPMENFRIPPGVRHKKIGHS